MSAIEPPARFAPRHLIPLVTFLLCIAAATAYECALGHLPWKGVEPTWSGLRDGSVARAVEHNAAARSATAELIRPRYNEAIWALCAVTTPAVTEGRDHWLFLSLTAHNYPPPGATELLAEEAHLSARLVRWFAAHGAAVIAVPVPNKETMAPEKLPSDSHVSPIYPAVIAAFREQGIEVVDLEPVLDLRRGDFYLRNDTHWTPAGSERAALAVGDMARRRFRDAIPGRAVKAVFHHLPDEIRRGDLQRMLGFEPDSWADTQFTTRTSSVYVVREDTGPVIDDDSAVVVCGTSFSAHFGFASMVAGALQRYVADRTTPGRGPTVKLLELAEAVRAGRAFPRLIVWEMPERSLFYSPEEYLLPLRDFLGRVVGDAPEVAPPVIRPFVWQTPRADGLDLAPTPTDTVLGESHREVASIELTLAAAEPADGSRQLVFQARSERDLEFRLVATSASGATGEAAVFRLRADSAFRSVVLPIRAAGPAVRLRLEVVGGPARFEMRVFEMWEVAR